MRTIDADAIVYELTEMVRHNTGEYKYGVSAARLVVMDAPTVATDTNVLGKWVRLTGMAPPEYHGHKICSVCESFAPYDPLHPWREMLTPYCPGCGAKMEVQNAAD